VRTSDGHVRPIMSRSPDSDICPPWFAWAINNPLRRWLHKPEEIFGRLVAPGARVVELGCGSGPFTIALAQMVGSSGRVIAVDVQQAMLAKVQRRVAQAGVQDRVELHLCEAEHVGLSVRVDFVLAFWMVHEVPNALALFAEMHEALNPDGKLLLVEPKLHVGRREFEKEVGAALEAKLSLLARPIIRLSHAALFAK
jgi:ubiquinone/menaquinone biosynthesis C-methylase UbiE